MKKEKLTDWIIALALGAAALVLYVCSLAGYAYPGESAHLMAVWQGLDAQPFNQYPLMAPFARLFGAGNALAPVCGALATMLVYGLVVTLMRLNIKGDETEEFALRASRLGGLVAAVVFLTNPAVRGAAAHLEPRLFDLTWALAALMLFVPGLACRKSLAGLFVFASGALAGLGLADTPLFLLLVPLFLAAAWTVSKRHGGRGYPFAALFAVVALAAFFVFAGNAAGDFGALMKSLKDAAKLYLAPKDWLFVLFFATLPFAVLLFSRRRAFVEQSGWTQWLFHLAMTFVSVLAIATPLAPASLMRPSGILPVAAVAFAATTAGYLAVYWYLQFVSAVRVNESVADQKGRVPKRIGRLLASVAGGVLAVAIVFTVLLDLFSFDKNEGAFADKAAEKVLADLGDRTWFVTDGTLDDHLRLAAARLGRELNLICLNRDLDDAYLAELGALVKEKQVGGARNADLALSLSLGVLPFVQDWFAADPSAAKEVAIFGAPDLWYTAQVTPVPEFLFFGGDASRTPDWNASWAAFKEILAAPDGWGSYRLWTNKDPVEKMRLNLRRHLGMVANDRGVWLQDAGRDEDAFDLYELVLKEIDTDNVCALFNEFEQARVGVKRAAAKKNELEKALKAIVDDQSRRYRLWALGNYYGYIRSPEIFIRLGFSWARSGRPGEALGQIRRAIDFIPTDNRRTVMNMMAALYASEHDARKSREVYESVLADDATNHDALIGLMRLELLDGNSEKAMEYLRQATEAAGDDPRANVENALLRLMRNELVEAKTLLKKVTDADHANLQAWSLMAAVTMQQIDAAKDEPTKAALAKELEDQILLTMEKQARSPGDYYVQTTKAFLLMRKGEAHRREARNALVAAAQDRPDIAATGDLILGLDISLNDTEHAERQARDMLRRNRKAPLANYVMGSLALQKGDYAQAESFLRRAADAPRPVALALNDLAEVLRRNKNYVEAERYARRAVEAEPRLYVAWETLGATLLDAKGNLDEAEAAVRKACELSKDKDGRDADVRMLITLARVQLARGDAIHGKTTLRMVQKRIDELSAFERSEFEELRKSAK